MSLQVWRWASCFSGWGSYWHGRYEVGWMKISGEAKLVRIFVGESDRWHGVPLYEAIVRKVREMGLAGATVIRGVEGFGANSRIHTAKILRLSEDLPVLIEI